MKYCPECMRHKEERSFGKDKQRADGLTVYCRSCLSTFKTKTETMSGFEKLNWLNHYKKKYWGIK
jgi:hypothetical protein